MRYGLGLIVITALSLVEIVAFMLFVTFITNLIQAKQGRSPVTWRQMLHTYPLFAVGVSVAVLSLNGGIAAFIWLFDRVGLRAAGILAAMAGGVSVGSALIMAGAALQARKRIR